MLRPTPDQHNKWRWLEKTLPFNAAKKQGNNTRQRTEISKSMARGNGNILMWGANLPPVPEEWGSGKLEKQKQRSGRRGRSRRDQGLTKSHSAGHGLSSAPFATD